VGVFGQRYSSTLLRISVIASLILAPVGPLALDAQAANGLVMPAHAVYRDQVHLPPVLKSLLVTLLGSCNLGDRPEAVEPSDHKPISPEEQLILLMTTAGELPRLYGDIKEYDGPAIRSLEEYISIVEPTSVDTGTLMGDRDAQYELLREGKLKPAARVLRRDQFASIEVWAQAKVYEYNKAQKIQRTLASLSPGFNSAYPSTVVASVIKGLVGVIVAGHGIGGILRQVSVAAKKANGETVAEPAAKPEPVVEAQVGPPAPGVPPLSSPGKVRAADFAALAESPVHLSNNMRKQWHNKKREAVAIARANPDAEVDYPFPRVSAHALVPVGPAPQLPVPAGTTTTGTTLAALGGMSIFTLGGIGAAASAGADLAESYNKISQVDTHIVDLVRKIDALPADAQLGLIQGAEEHMAKVVLPELNRIATRISESADMENIEGTQVRELVRLFFSDYPKTLESDVTRDFFRDILNLPLDTSDYSLAEILIKHYDPIAQQLFQTVVSKGPLAKIFSRMRDDGKTAPPELVRKVLEEDPNDYPLENISALPIKAGKLFQVHTAQWRNADDTRTPVVVRILKPGVEERLDRARIRLRRMAGRLSDALKNADGTGPSKRRVEQLIEMFYRNLKQELRVDLTVTNQNRAATRLARKLTVDLPGGDTARLEVFVPKAYPAKPGSKVMVMEQVDRIVPLERMKQQSPEIVAAFADALVDITFRDTLIKPMEAAQNTELAESSDERLGMMHGDKHTGNFLFQEAVNDGDSQVFRVALIDFGLVAWVKPDQVQELVTLAVGASYNSAPFIIDSIWNMRSPETHKFHATVIEDMKQKLSSLVTKKCTELNASQTYWTAAEWVGFVWENEAVELPSWLILMKQGFLAVQSSYDELGKHPSEMAKLHADFAQQYRDLTKAYLQQRTRGHKGWAPIRSYEVKAAGRRCWNALLRPFGLAD